MRIARFITMRLAGGIGVVIAVVFGLIYLSEILDTSRLSQVMHSQGLLFALSGPAFYAARWSLEGLPVTTLIGAIITLVDLQSHRELLVIKASGVSIWRLVAMPVIAMIIAASFVSFLVDGWVTEGNRYFNPSSATSDQRGFKNGEVWLRQGAGEEHYVMHAWRDGADPTHLRAITVYFVSGPHTGQLSANRAVMRNAQWHFTNARLLTPSGQRNAPADFTLPTDSTRAGLALKLGAVGDFTFAELERALTSGITDPVTRAGAETRFGRLVAMPFLLVGSLLIAFAFTAGYRRSGTNGSRILYGIVLGFVMFVITEMADRAGSAGVLDPTFAAWGPAVVSIVIGVAVLLYREDGRA